jgi:Protein of unknown function (DUF3363)
LAVRRKPGLEAALRDLGIRGDIIKTMHRAMSGADREPNIAGFALHGDRPGEPVLGRLVERGLHDELKGTAYAIIEGVDGRTHHLVFPDLEMTGDARPGAIVETRSYDDAAGRKRLSLATRCDLTIETQIAAPGATWLDRQLLAKESAKMSVDLLMSSRFLAVECYAIFVPGAEDGSVGNLVGRLLFLGMNFQLFD